MRCTDPGLAPKVRADLTRGADGFQADEVDGDACRFALDDERPLFTFAGIWTP